MRTFEFVERGTASHRVTHRRHAQLQEQLVRMPAEVRAQRVGCGRKRMARLGAWLARTGYAVGEVRLRLGWLSGGEQGARRLLHAPTSDAGLLAREAECMLTRIITLRLASPEDLVSVCQLIVARYAPALPALQVLWASPLGRHEVVAQFAEVLHARHGKALLTQAIVTSPAAIFDERRFRLLPYAQAAHTPDVASPRVRAVGDWDEVPQRLHWW